MKRQELFSLEYGVDKNGATGYLIEDLQALLIEWRGDILHHEFMEVLVQGFKQVIRHGLTNWIGDTTLMNTPVEETTQYVGTTFPKRAHDHGIKNFIVVLPADAMGAIFVQEALDSLKGVQQDMGSGITAYYSSNLLQALEWVKQNTK